jgi:hypothetical protein
MADPAANALDRGHEVADIKAWFVACIAAGLAGVIAMIAVGAFALLHAFHAERAPGAPLAPAANRDVVQLQSAPARDLAALRGQKQALLEEYRWLDKSTRTVHIPIEQAMRLIAQRNAATAASVGVHP